MSGVCDDVISQFLVSGNGITSRHHSLPSYSQHRPVSVGSTVHQLEQLLGPKRPRCLEPSKPFIAPSGQNPGCFRPSDGVVFDKSQGTSTTVASPAGDYTTHRDNPAAFMIFQQPQYQPSQEPQHSIQPDAGTTISRTDAALALTGLGQTSADQQSPATGSGASLPTPPYTYTMQRFPGPSGYTQQQANGQHLLGPSAEPIKYMQASPGEQICPMATNIISGITDLDPQYVYCAHGCGPGHGCHVDA